MNFNPTPLKSVVSLLTGIFADYILTTGVRISCMCETGKPCPCYKPTFIEQAFDPVPLTIFLIVIVLVYCIWSAFQKDNKKK